ncbi:FHA domain-containing protein [Photobacterium rosenbergii]|uniref:FHA domain-containing protein n=1 Tax=Photobacterium rosenbergii TaxID=294936 RepID=A0ABU3ZCH0_9GAMM|nr:FHA domain-containing protein [Photobacterium rosenbergii]MDV5167808.1 FHA domain-containing protein [Photobacterium rosenbergii]
MAYLTTANSKFPVFLKAFHQFGRLATAVDTLIDSPEISRIHAVVEWIDNVWYVRDLSKNGLQVNGETIQANKLYKLSLDDNLMFAGQPHITFTVLNLDKPADVLIPVVPEGLSSRVNVEPIYLEHYHFLPTESSPEVIIFYDTKEKSWYCENVNECVTSKINDGEMLEFSHSMWQLIEGADVSEKETIAVTDDFNSKVCYVFNISQDEELTKLIIINGNKNINCEIRSHHYLTALLARYKGEDSINDVPETQRGWRSIEQLSKDIGLSESHINIQIHRARKQLADKMNAEGINEPMLIERQRGRVRLAVNDFKVFKGEKLEVEVC